tara:strand:- start:115 stop:282 length:168 start_codon:yes stop_codon:yes gene_type:complete
MTTKQINWAMQHDWYIYTDTSQLTGEHTVYVKDDEIYGRSKSFKDFIELKQWAGY